MKKNVLIQTVTVLTLALLGAGCSEQEKPLYTVYEKAPRELENTTDVTNYGVFTVAPSEIIESINELEIQYWNEIADIELTGKENYLIANFESVNSKAVIALSGEIIAQEPQDDIVFGSPEVNYIIRAREGAPLIQEVALGELIDIELPSYWSSEIHHLTLSPDHRYLAVQGKVPTDLALYSYENKTWKNLAVEFSVPPNGELGDIEWQLKTQHQLYTSYGEYNPTRETEKLYKYLKVNRPKVWYQNLNDSIGIDENNFIQNDETLFPPRQGRSRKFTYIGEGKNRQLAAWIDPLSPNILREVSEGIWFVGFGHNYGILQTSTGAFAQWKLPDEVTIDSLLVTYPRKDGGYTLPNEAIH